MERTRPISLRIDAATHCQLKCPSCATAKGEIGKQLGGGFLDPDHLKKLIDENPTVAHVELSNWGEIFLNKRLPEILEYAYEKGVALSAGNGVNLNHATDEQLEAVVKYRLWYMTVSLDGASQETYSQYRVKGNFDTVISHVEKINAFKKQYKSAFPVMNWQYIAFGHNEHEISKAREMAEKLGMLFWVKLSWDSSFSPIKDLDLVRKQTKGGAASRSEYAEKKKSSYIQKSLCRQLWEQPQINWDGRVLGCCVNRWSDFGNAFEATLDSALDSDKMRYAKQMLMGEAEPIQDVPCTECAVYKRMREADEYMTPADLQRPSMTGLPYELAKRGGRDFVRLMGRSPRLANAVVKPLIHSIVKRVMD